MTKQELTAAKDYLERGVAILNKCGCVIAEVAAEINRQIGENK